MARNMTINQLTEGIRERHLGAERNRLVEKWTRTGLLRGMDDHNRETMSQLLENQAAQLLREANTLGSGGNANNIDGFSNIAFPIVRRVFGGLVANELVSIQPMSLPSGLLFYLDYTYGSDVGGDATASANELAGTNVTYEKGQSLYNNPAGAGVRTGSDAVGGQYDLVGTAYSKVHGTYKLNEALAHIGKFGTGATQSGANGVAGTSGADGKLLQFDPQIIQRIDEGSNEYAFLVASASVFVEDASTGRRLDPSQIKQISLFSNSTTTNGFTVPGSNIQGGNNILNVRRLNQLGTMAGAQDAITFTPNPLVSLTDANAGILFVMQLADGATPTADAAGLGAVTDLTASFPVADVVAAEGGTGGTLVIPSFESNFASEPTPVIPEIDIKIESIAVTATTRKLRARWSPELAQDLNAYHSLDAEVELTQILSEQIALEIDREILNDLLVEARGANFFWSRAPGKFVNKRSGVAQNLASSLATGPQFTGTVREWYETLVETIIDVANEIHRKTLRGSANFIVCSPEVATIFEASVLYKPTIKIDGQGQTGPEFSIGAQAIGSLSNRFTVYKDPYFPRNKILVGYKGGSYLETGYVYAPYVPLIVTPTLFAPEDFTPRKGVMTRYGKKMVRADFYGTVTCLDMDII
jgi:hypothetical protein